MNRLQLATGSSNVHCRITAMLFEYMYMGYGRLLIIATCLICFGFIALFVIIPLGAKLETDVRTEFFSTRSAVACIYLGLSIIALVAIAASIRQVLGPL